MSASLTFSAIRVRAARGLSSSGAFWSIYSIALAGMLLGLHFWRAA